MQWGDYVPFNPEIQGPLGNLPRREARRHYNRLMEAKKERIQALATLLEQNGVMLGSSDVALQDLNDWFLREIEPDNGNPRRLAPRWFGPVQDLALYLGDTMIERSPGLRWEFFTWGKKNLSYHRPVIMGFSKVQEPKYNVDPGWSLVVYGNRAAAGERVEEDVFWQWVKASESKSDLLC
jgi:hypothetical protein